MDTKQHQSQKLLTSIDEESEYNDPVFINDKKYGQEVGVFRKREILGYLPWALHLTVFLAYIIFISIQNLPKPEKKEWPNIYDGLTINERFHETSPTSPFQGRPNKASEEAWHHMLNVGVVSITEEEKSRLPFETAPNAFKKNEYVVELNVFHQLHCLHGLRQQLYNPRHLPWQNGEPVTFWEFHMNHCIEHLRETLMCNADITPQRFDWDEKKQIYLLDGRQQFPHCKIWADIWSWAEGRNTTGDNPTNVGDPTKPAEHTDVGDW